MTEQRYDIYFRGETLSDADINQVKARVGQLFKASPDKIELLFSGKTIALKKGLDKATALKFKQALEKAQAKIYIKAATTTPANQAAEPKTQQTVKIRNENIEAAPPPLPTVDDETSTTTAPQTTIDMSKERTQIDMSGPIFVLNAGGNLVDESEREEVEALEVDISAISLESQFSLPDDSNTEKDNPPHQQAPDVSHITTADAGADVLEGYEAPPPPPAPDVSHITAVDVGADVLEGYETPPPPPAPDVSHLSTAAIGADINPTEKTPPPPAPDVSHIQLD